MFQLRLVARSEVFYSVTDPITGTLFGMFRGVSTSRASKAYIEPATAAERRIEQLLIYREGGNCLSGRTADAALDDSKVLDALRSLALRLEREEISREQYFPERRRLFDDLR